MNIDFNYIFSLFFKGFLLGNIVFAATTYIPENVPSLRNRIIIALVVAIIYMCIDYIQYLLRAMRNLTCRIACGCNPGDVPSSSASNALDLDINNLTKTLDLDTPAGAAGAAGAAASAGKTVDSKKCSA